MGSQKQLKYAIGVRDRSRSTSLEPCARDSLAHYPNGIMKHPGNYIERQKEHHRQTSFLEEYRNILDENGVSYEEEYLFKEPE